MTINSHILKLTGKAELPKELELGFNYKVTIDGSVTETTTVDNENGTVDVIYKFLPVLVETLTPKGERLKLKDVRKESQKLRAKLYMVWSENNDSRSFEDFYNFIMMKIRLNAESIIEEYK